MPCYRRSRPRAPRRADLDDPRQRQARRSAVQQWRSQYGDWCPGWQRPGHPAEKLTADHPVEVARGGNPTPGEFLILCLSCNVTKANRALAAARAAPRPAGSRDWEPPRRDREW